MFFYYIVKFLAVVFYNIFYPHKIYGKENIPTDTNFILICNHYGKIDALVTASLLKGRPSIMGKKELAKNKIAGGFFRFMGLIPVDRGNADIKAIKECFTVLKKGENLIVFPEGTRNKTSNDLLEVKSGAAVLAFKTGVKVVPMAMNSRFRFLHKGYAYIGEPFDFSEYSGNKLDVELERQLKDITAEKLQECKDKLKELVK